MWIPEHAPASSKKAVGSNVKRPCSIEEVFMTNAKIGKF